MSGTAQQFVSLSRKQFVSLSQKQFVSLPRKQFVSLSYSFELRVGCPRFSHHVRGAVDMSPLVVFVHGFISGGKVLRRFYTLYFIHLSPYISEGHVSLVFSTRCICQLCFRAAFQVKVVVCIWL